MVYLIHKQILQINRKKINTQYRHAASDRKLHSKLYNQYRNLSFYITRSLNVGQLLDLLISHDFNKRHHSTQTKSSGSEAGLLGLYPSSSTYWIRDIEQVIYLIYDSCSSFENGYIKNTISCCKDEELIYIKYLLSVDIIKSSFFPFFRSAILSMLTLSSVLRLYGMR